MKLINFLKVTFTTFNKRKFRTFINISSIAIGVALITTLVSLGSELQKYIMDKVKNADSLKLVTMDNVEYLNDDELQNKLSQTNENGDIDVNDVFVHKTINGDTIAELNNRSEINEYITEYTDNLSDISYNDKKIKDVKIGYYDNASYLDSEKRSLANSNNNINVKYILSGRELNNNDALSVVLPEYLVTTTFGVENTDNIIGKEINIESILPDYNGDKTYQQNVKVVGVIDNRYSETSVLVSKDIMDAVKKFNNQDDKSLIERGYDNIKISISDINDVNGTVNFIENELGYATENVKTVADSLDKILFQLKIVLVFISVIISIVASFDIINTMIMTIYERTKIIGLMKATGATNLDILSLYLIEGALIGLFGGIIGTIISLFSLNLIRPYFKTILTTLNFTDTSILDNVVTINSNIALLTILFAIILSTLASFYPAIKASKLNPIDALKHE